MKKTLFVFVLVVLCLFSGFAAEIAVRISFTMSFGSNGSSMVLNNDELTPAICFSVSEDHCGASLDVSAGGSFDSVHLDGNVWLKPVDFIKTTLGFRFKLGFDDAKVEKELISYGKADIQLTESSDSSFGVAFRNDGSLYCSGLLNLSVSSDVVIHVDGLAKVVFDADGADLDYVKTELTCGNYSYNKSALFQNFRFDDSRYFEEQDDWARFESTWLTSYPKGKLGAGYDFTRGFYGIGRVIGPIEDVADCEFDFKVYGDGASVSIGAHYRDDSSSQGRALAAIILDWSDKLTFRMDDSIAFFNLAIGDDSAVGLRFKYDDDEGICLSPAVSTVVGVCYLQINGLVSLNTDQSFEWGVSINPSMSF